MNVSLLTGALGAFLALGLTATLGAQGVFSNLGNGSAYSVSDDGSVVVIENGGTFRWTAAGGRVEIRPSEGVGGMAAMSGDGNLVVADIKDANGDTVAGLWSSAGGWASLGYLYSPCGSSGSAAYRISADGSTVVGLSWVGCSGRAFQWDAFNGMLELPRLGTSSARANAVSGDGTVVGGWDEASWGGRRAALWFPGGAEVLLIPPTANDPDGIGEVLDINSNGSVIVGGEGLNGLQPFRWTSTGGYQRLGRIPGVNVDPPFAYATNEDGSVIGGAFGNAFGSAVAFLWTEEDGMRRLDDVLADQGITVPAVGSLAYVFDITPDGRHLVGRRTPGAFGSAAFRVKMPEGVRYGVRVGGNNTLRLTGTGSTQIGSNLVVTTSNVITPSVSTVIGLKSTRLPLLGGTLLVDLSLPHLVWNSPVTSGTAAFALPMPNVPALVGASLYLQSVALGQTIFFSNGIKATITD